MPTRHRSAAALAALGLLVACLAGCISGPPAQGSGMPTNPSTTATPGPTPTFSSPSPWPTPVAARPAPRMQAPHECPAGTEDVILVPEARTEREVLETLRVCADADRVVVINAGPLVWVIDSPILTDNREPSSFAAAAFHRAVVTRYADSGVVPILPGEEIGLSGVAAADLHLRLDADIQSLWLTAGEVSASTPGALTDQTADGVRTQTAKLVAACALKSLAASNKRLTPDPTDLQLAQLLLTSARSACRHELAELDRLGDRLTPGAIPVSERLRQRATTLRLSRPTATTEAWAIRFLRFITAVGARAG